MISKTREDFHVTIVGRPRLAHLPHLEHADKFTGAGIAGLALAMGLHRKGISFTIYEVAKEYSVVG
jgi:hypothetical protein